MTATNATHPTSESGSSVAVVHVPLGERAYEVHIGAGVLSRVGALTRAALPAADVVAMVTDVAVDPLWGRPVQGSLEAAGLQVVKVCRIPRGEAGKTLSVLEQTLEALAVARLTRRSALVAVGGGAVGDHTGFAAAVYQRGIPFVQVPTTLLAQVDASVGGKTAVNLAAGKNLVGSFHQPALVVADPAPLTTLEPRDVASGLAEVVKHGLLADPALLELLEVRAEDARGAEPGVMERCVIRSCEIKSAIVARDEREAGDRALLNLGHTVGHAIEAFGAYELRHGEAVALGLLCACRVSHRLGLAPASLQPRVARLLTRLGLPSDIADYLRPEVMVFVESDKKRQQLGVRPSVRFIALREVGQPEIVSLPLDELMQLLLSP
jgi:3-dehydroquinate synthase